MDKNADFIKRLLSTFRIEAQEHIKTISTGLLELEKGPPPGQVFDSLEKVFRATHSLKGAARAVNMRDVESICQTMETIFAGWKRTGAEGAGEAIDTLYSAIEVMRSIIYEDPAQGTGRTGVSRTISELSAFEDAAQPGRLSAKPREGAAPGQRKEPPIQQEAGAFHPRQDHPAVSETVRISSSRISSLLLQVEDMLGFKQAAAQHASNISELSEMLSALKNELARANSELVSTGAPRANGTLEASRSSKMREFMNWGSTHIKLMEGRFKKLSRSSMQYSRSMERMMDGLLSEMKETAMLPFSNILESFPMLTRDIAHEQGKAVDLVVKGAGVEIDRRILEEIKDPLIHLVRNCIDHGIEKTDVRQRLKKAPRGSITIAITPVDAGRAEVLISDDGAGIDLSKVKKAAVEGGVIDPQEADGLDARQALSLVFHSGVSTSPIITGISGRGLGLAIVREKVEKLSGSISLDSAPGAGTSFKITLPLTVSTFRGVLVEAAGQAFIVPTSNLERSIRVPDETIKSVENKDTIELDGKPLAFVRLEAALELGVRKRDPGSKYTQAVVLSSTGRRIAFGVDSVMGEQEVIVKGLGSQLSRVRNVSGAAVLGSGRPVPILNVPDLMRSAVKAAPVGAVIAKTQEEGEAKSVLVAEDSITSRILLKTILESAGYAVKTAVDGIEAITLLKSEHFDLVVSDVEMPRMNGFDLTAKIRADKKLSETPVVLVTALETREDKERGIDVGANAYIIKSSFSNSNLLDAVKKLI